MSNPSKQRGTAAETAVVRWLETNGHPSAERRTLRGNHDEGDIAGIPGLTIEIKACKRLELAQWCDELAAEKKNSQTDHAVLIVKRRGTTDVGAWYAILPVADYLQLWHETDR